MILRCDCTKQEVLGSELPELVVIKGIPNPSKAYLTKNKLTYCDWFCDTTIPCVVILPLSRILPVPPAPWRRSAVFRKIFTVEIAKKRRVKRQAPQGQFGKHRFATASSFLSLS